MIRHKVDRKTFRPPKGKKKTKRNLKFSLNYKNNTNARLRISNFEFRMQVEREKNIFFS